MIVRAALPTNYPPPPPQSHRRVTTRMVDADMVRQGQFQSPLNTMPRNSVLNTAERKRASMKKGSAFNSAVPQWPPTDIPTYRTDSELKEASKPPGRVPRMSTTEHMEMAVQQASLSPLARVSQQYQVDETDSVAAESALVESDETSDGEYVAGRQSARNQVSQVRQDTWVKELNDGSGMRSDTMFSEQDYQHRLSHVGNGLALSDIKSSSTTTSRANTVRSARSTYPFVSRTNTVSHTPLRDHTLRDHTPSTITEPTPLRDHTSRVRQEHEKGDPRKSLPGRAMLRQLSRESTASAATTSTTASTTSTTAAAVAPRANLRESAVASELLPINRLRVSKADTTTSGVTIDTSSSEQDDETFDTDSYSDVAPPAYNAPRQASARSTANHIPSRHQRNDEPLIHQDVDDGVRLESTPTITEATKGVS